MSRLTEIDEYGNADIIGMEDETWQMGLSFNDMNRVTLALNRLHRLEKMFEQRKRPDPETGLVPCGCGGKASFYYWDARVQAGCEECSMETAHLLSCDEARDEWNISHGYKGDA